jgi:hypothetical protein|tara:strand:+ start:592 stop:804 length:213 start_codon:yes stop_codon:yes gene_type:complete
MKETWKIWKYALGSFSDHKTANYDNWVCSVRTFILITYLITNCFIIAGVLRHWKDTSSHLNYGTLQSRRY